MKIITKVLLASTCLLFLKQNVLAMQREEEQNIIPTRSNPQILTQQNEDGQNFDHSSQLIDSAEGGESVLLHSQMLLENEQEATTNDLHKNLTNITINSSDAKILPLDILIQIFSFLDIQDIERGICVSSHWKTVLDTPKMWRNIGLSNIV